MDTEFRPQNVAERKVYRTMTTAVIPRPIGWISSCDADGNDNLAPYSFFNAVCVDPPIVLFSHSQHVEGRLKDTPRNILETGEFVHNIVNENVAESMHQTSSEVPPDTSEFDVFDIRRVESTCVSPPRVADALVAFECSLERTIDLGSHSLVLGEIEYIHLDDAVTTDAEIDLEKLRAIGRLSAGMYTETSQRFGLDKVMSNTFLNDEK